MQDTNIEWNCKSCSKPFRLFSDDAADDRTICWNYCPHCGAKNDIWIRLLYLAELKNVPVGIGAEEAASLTRTGDE